jgi:hypothetical protein
MLPTKFRFIWPSSFRGEDLKKIVQSEIIVLLHPTKPKVVILELEKNAEGREK